jgi:hypothetical protein
VSNVIRLSNLEGGDEGRHGSPWDGVCLVMGVTVSETPIKFHNVHTFQDVSYSSNILKVDFDLMDSMCTMPTYGTLK